MGAKKRFSVIALFSMFIHTIDCRIWNTTASGTIGGRANLSCFYEPLDSDAKWLYDASNISPDDQRIKLSYENVPMKDEKDVEVKVRVSTLTIDKISADLEGNYTCRVYTEDIQHMEKVVELKLKQPARIIEKAMTPLKRKSGESAILFCVFEGYKLSDIKWKKKYDVTAKLAPGAVSTSRVNETIILGKLNLTDLTRTDNGTYSCEVYDPGLGDKVSEDIDVLVLEKPQVSIDYIKGVESRKIYLNWTVNDGNSPIEFYRLQYRKNGSETWLYYSAEVGGGNESFVMDGLEPGVSYQIKISAKNAQGLSQAYTENRWVTTLEKDPHFVPEIIIKGFTMSSVTIGWYPPPEDLVEYIQYYELEATKKDGNFSSKKEAIHSGHYRNLPYMFEDLQPATTYIFRVRACSEYTRHCGNWSSAVNGTTMDSIAGPPARVSLHCHLDRVSGVLHANVTWDPPETPNGRVIRYEVKLEGQATYQNDEGFQQNATWGPKTRYAADTATSLRFENLPVNTNYTSSVSAVTRTKRAGVVTSAHCTAPPMPPAPAALHHFTWYKKMDDDGRFLFNLRMSKLSERSGAICCYRVVLVRLSPKVYVSDLPNPESLKLVSYQEAHSSDKGGAYVAEMFTNNHFPKTSEVLLGDGYSYNGLNDRALATCGKCVSKLDTIASTTPRDEIPSDVTISENILQRIPDLYSNTTKMLETSPGSRTLRHVATYDRAGVLNSRLPRETDVFSNTMRESGATSGPTRNTHPAPPPIIRSGDSDVLYDGPLDVESNYTAVVQVVVESGDNAESVFGDYLKVMHPGPDTLPAQNDQLDLLLKIICGTLGIAGLALAVTCAVLSRRRKPRHVSSLHDTLRNLYRGLKGRGSDSVRATLNVPPIPADMLTAAYLARSADSDLGFQREFEMLPDSFPDRTTQASEARENQSKNRYPDIKAYDQTRVKLNPIATIPGSDYINANYVTGYKECHRYICAQGPTDATVHDFWRMIWEQGVEVVVMLTNLEEYSKVKCTKYWPDEPRGSRVFGTIAVEHLNETRYSDYIVRQLKISKHLEPESESQSMEKDELCTRNGSIGGEERILKQFHYLMWKDFVAPDYPQAVLHFLKRLDEAGWCAGSGGVIHCSAGVGRTGTLVALHALRCQLEAQRHVTVHSMVAALRSQRNYLVQSLKQYIFIYRALVELAHYGDTEIAASQLKNTIDRLRHTPDGSDKCLMEEEFEKMQNPPLPEPLKSCSAGSSEENTVKNRQDAPPPYDRNRVILSPISGRDFSTYINASFIQGYDNSECYIITQDPLPTTIADFWRMISEQEVNTIVMLSELGDGERKCPRYWDDGTVQYDHISVEYCRSESCPYYTKREFIVTNTKNQETLTCYQYQYHGWPTVCGQVPEVTRGLCELADATRETISDGGRLVTHCSRAGERAALYVALSLLVQQLRASGRLDVSSTARKLMHQREGLIETFLQYEFLYRAILNYAELHNLLEEGS